MIELAELVTRAGRKPARRLVEIVMPRINFG